MGRKKVRKGNNEGIEVEAWVILVMQESGSALHPKLRFNSTEKCEI